MERPTPAHRPPARTSTHLEEDFAHAHTNTIPRIDGRSSRQRYSMAQISSSQPRCLSQPCHAHRRRTPERPRSGHRHPISCPVSRLGPPRTAFNPHTLTALAAYCKSPYPHRSASTASEHEKFSPRSTADTALEISHQVTMQSIAKNSTFQLFQVAPQGPFQKATQQYRLN
jgi:hypothetical protein